MGKASTNAGIHPYLKPDFKSSIPTEIENKGKPLSIKSQKILTIVNTEYKDCKKKDLYFKDEVELDGLKYIIDYDSKNFKWILIHDRKIIVLKDVNKRVLLTKKYSAR